MPIKQSNLPLSVLYARTAQPSEKNIAKQKALLEYFAKKNNLGNPILFVDNGVSGMNFDRSELNKSF